MKFREVPLTALRPGLHQQLLPHPAQPRGQGRPASGAALAGHHGHSRQEAGTRVTIVASSDHQQLSTVLNMKYKIRINKYRLRINHSKS